VRSIIRGWPVSTFVVIVFGLTALVMLAGLGRETTPFGLVLVIPFAAMLAAWLVGGRSMVRGLFKRIARWRVPARWYVLALGIPILGVLAIDLVGIVLGQTDATTIIDSLDASVLLVPLVVLLPALFEEFAWRGYGVEVMLQRGASFARASASDASRLAAASAATR
jgi:membrane protease YdiL (CAAX protease family)